MVSRKLFPLEASRSLLLLNMVTTPSPTIHFRAIAAIAAIAADHVPEDPFQGPVNFLS